MILFLEVKEAERQKLELIFIVNLDFSQQCKQSNWFIETEINEDNSKPCPKTTTGCVV